MRFVRAATNKKIAAANVFPDDRVAVALEKLRVELGAPVYLWCTRPLTAHEALGVVVADTGWSAAAAQAESAPAVARSMFTRFGVKFKSKPRVSRLDVLEALLRAEAAGRLAETVSCEFRYLVPGGYFADHVVDPLRRARALLDAPPVDKLGIVSTAELLLEAFGAEEFMVATRADLERARPEGVQPAAWAARLARYRLGEPRDPVPGALADAERYAVLMKGALGDAVTVAESVLTYAKVAGSEIFVDRTVDALMTAFADSPATAERPLLRLGVHSLGTVLTRTHASLEGSPELERYLVSSRKDFLQVLLAIPGRAGAHALLEMFPGSYQLSVRFGVAEAGTLEAFAAVFPDANAVLRAASPYFVPVDKCAFHSRYSVHSVKLSEYVPAAVDMWFATTLAPRERACDLRRFYESAARGGSPVLQAVNVSRDDRRAYLQFARSSNLSREALVRNFLAQNGEASASALARRVVAAYGLGEEEADEFVRDFREGGYSWRVGRVGVLRVERASNSRVVLRMENLVDARAAGRATAAVMTLLRECARPAAKAGNAAPKVDVIRTMSKKAMSKVGDLDVFMDIVNISEPGAAAIVPESVAVDTGNGSDVLRLLQRRDPDVFAYKASGVFRPYSVNCQDRQPVVLSDDELRRARDGSSPGSFEGALRYGSRAETVGNYVCPQKWCVTSGVARLAGEACPIADEPAWEFGDSTTYPAYISGAKNPNGKCMPCCFKKKPVEGSKVHRRFAECEGSGRESGNDKGEGVSVTAGVSAARDRGHLSRHTRVLDSGSLGKLPPEIAAALPAGLVRVGMGARTTFFDAVAAAVGRDVLADLRAEMRMETFLMGPRLGLRPEVPRDSAAFDAWWRSGASASYRAMFGLPAALAPAQRRREVALFQAFRNAQVAADAPHGDWLRALNVATPIADPHVVVVCAPDPGRVHATVAVDRVRDGRKSAVIIMVREGRYEPVGSAVGGAFDATLPLAAVARILPAPVDVAGTRVVSPSGLVEAVVVDDRLLALARPETVDAAAGVAHAHVDDVVRRTLKYGAAEARAAFAATRDPFYKDDAAAATRAYLADAATDVRLAADVHVADRRHELLRGIAARGDANAKHAAAIWAVIGDDPLVRDPAVENSDRFRKLREKYAAKLPKIDAGLLEYVMERLVRPVPVYTVPTVVQAEGENISAFTK